MRFCEQLSRKSRHPGGNDGHPPNQKVSTSSLIAHLFFHEVMRMEVRIAMINPGVRKALWPTSHPSFRVRPPCHSKRSGLVLPHIRVHQERWTMPVKYGDDVLAGKTRHLRPRCDSGTPEMRCEYSVVAREQCVIRHNRFHLEYINCCPGNGP